MCKSDYSLLDSPSFECFLLVIMIYSHVYKVLHSLAPGHALLSEMVLVLKGLNFKIGYFIVRNLLSMEFKYDQQM